MLCFDSVIFGLVKLAWISVDFVYYFLTVNPRTHVMAGDSLMVSEKEGSLVGSPRLAGAVTDTTGHFYCNSL